MHASLPTHGVAALILTTLVLAHPALGAAPEPPQFTGLANNLNGVWIDGVFVSDHVMKGSYRLYWSESSHETGIKHYTLQESTVSDFSSTSAYWFVTETSYQFYLKTNSTYHYRVSATASNDEQSGWSGSTNTTVSIEGVYPPTTPDFSALTRNVTADVWVAGQILSNYVHEADYMIHVVASESGEGVSHYEIQKAVAPWWFLFVDLYGYQEEWFTNQWPPVRLYAPPYPSPEYDTNVYDHPVHQIYQDYYFSTNGIVTNYFRVRAVDVNGFQSEWNTIYDTNNLGAYSNLVIHLDDPCPPTVPGISAIQRNVEEDVWVNGAIVSNYTHEADYMIHVTKSPSGSGVDVYEIQETKDPAWFQYVDSNGYPAAWFNNPTSPVRVYAPPYPSPEYDTNVYNHPVHQVYLQSNGTYYYRVRACDINGFKTDWDTAYPGPYSNITVDVAAPCPPTVPQITSIEPNIFKMVFEDGELVTYTAKPNYMIHMTVADSGEGVNCYEMQETKDPWWFQYVDANGYPASWFNNPTSPVRIYAPPYPSPEYDTNEYNHPVHQVYLQSNGTYYYRVRACDINGFKSDWNVAYPGPYTNITIAVPEPYPPATPALTTNGCQNFDGDVYLSFADVESGDPVNIYEIVLSTDPAFATTNDWVLSPFPYYVWEDLPAGTYYLKARAEDWNGYKSDWSVTILVTNGMPPAVSGLQIEQVSTNTAVVRWTTDLPARGEVERRGMFHLFDEWRDPTNYVQGVDYAPAESHGYGVTTNDVIEDLEQLRANNVNVINLYNLGWEELQQNGDVERCIFDKARDLGMKIVIRMEVYNKFKDKFFVGGLDGNNYPEKHFAYRPQDAEWIIDYYTERAHVFGADGYVDNYSDVILYYVINLPFDDRELRRQDGIGLNDYPDEATQRAYVTYFYSRIKTLDPNHPVFANVFYSGMDNLDHFQVADLLDGISILAYPERVNYYYRAYGYVPGADDPDYLLLAKDTYEYHFDKHYAVNRIASNGKPVVVDQTGLCEVNNSETGRVKDKRAKAQAIRALADFMARNSVISFGWSYFMVHDKFDESGEWATWGLVDRSNEFIEEFDRGDGEWTQVSGSWAAADGQYGSSGTGTEIALVGLGQKKGGIEAQLNTGNTGNTNVFLVFSYQDASNYRYAGYDGDAARWVIGEVESGVTNILASTGEGDQRYVALQPSQDYTLRVVVNFTRVRLDVDLARRVVEYNLPSYKEGRIGLLTHDTSKPFEFFKAYGRLIDPQMSTNHTFVLRELYPGTEYRIRAMSGGVYSPGSNFTTMADTSIQPRPSITITSPGYEHVLATNGSCEIRWVAYDPLGDAYIDLYYDRNEKAQVGSRERPESNSYHGTLIASNIKAVDGLPASRTWNLAGVPAGSYYVCARIHRPGSGQPAEYDYSSGKVLVSDIRMPAIRIHTTNVVVDGLLTDAAWTNAPYMAYAAAGSGASTAIARVKLLWDDRYLYVGYDVVDPQVAWGSELTNSDGVGVTIDNGRLSRNRLDASGRSAINDLTDTNNALYPFGTEWALASVSGGYQAEIRLRWDTLRTIPQTPTVVPVDLPFVDRTDGGSVSARSWDGSDDEWIVGRSMLLVDSLAEFLSGAPPPLPVASSESAGFEAGRAFDNDAVTRWAAQALDGEWIFADFLEPRAFDAIVLDWDAGYGSRYDIQASDDGLTWNTLQTEDSGDGGTDVIVLGAQTSRFVRMLGIERGTADGYSLREFEIYSGDSDADGMPDWWELACTESLTSMTAVSDADGDGFPDSSEWVAGTDPFNDGSLLGVDADSAEVVSGGADVRIVLQWPSESNRVYEVQRSSDILQGFSAIASGLPATPPLNTYTDYLGEAETALYRVRVAGE